ncbi:hypothetical protein V8E36_006925, partial [Tilletia maclaganii]
GLLAALRADVRELLHAFASSSSSAAAAGYATFVAEWERRGWARVGFLFGESRWARARWERMLGSLFVEHFTPLHHFLLLHERDPDSDGEAAEMPSIDEINGRNKGKGIAGATQRDRMPGSIDTRRTLVLNAVGALFALYTMYAAPAPAAKERAIDSATGAGDGGGCLQLIPIPTWAELVLAPILRARGPESAAAPEASSSTSASLSKSNHRRQMQPAGSKARPKPVSRSSEPAASSTTKVHQQQEQQQRELESISGQIPVDPDEGRILVDGEVLRRTVVRLAGLVEEVMLERGGGIANTAATEMRREEELGLVEDVGFVLWSLCRGEGGDGDGDGDGEAASGSPEIGSDDVDWSQMETGIFKIVPGAATSSALTAGSGQDGDTADGGVSSAFGPLWRSTSVWNRLATVPGCVGGYVSLRRQPHSLHLALSRAEALRWAVKERTDISLGPLISDLLKERARAEVWSRAPRYALTAEEREEDEGVAALIEGRFEFGVKDASGDGEGEIWVDRGLLLEAERKACAAIGSGLLDRAGEGLDETATEASTAQQATRIGGAADTNASASSSATKGRFVRVPESCLSRVSDHVAGVLGGRGRGHTSTSDAVLALGGVQFGAEDEDDDDDEDDDEMDEVLAAAMAHELEADLTTAPDPSPPASTSAALALPGAGGIGMGLALPGLGRSSAQQEQREAAKKKATAAAPRKRRARTKAADGDPKFDDTGVTISLGALEAELEGVLVEARRRTVRALTAKAAMLFARAE